MITLSSDFKSPYPAAMKGVIASKCDARMIDISHEFSRQNIRESAFWLDQILPWFPPCVHLVVVDPGVGTDRRAVVVSAGNHRLIGPDNGVLVPVARSLGDEDSFDVYDIRVDCSESNTFHGRDVFAPMAAELTTSSIDDLRAQERLRKVTTFESLEFPHPSLEESTIRGEVLVVDGFGNVITNIPRETIGARPGGTLLVNNREIQLLETYGETKRDAPLATIGSHNNLELAVREGRGDTYFELEPGDSVRVDLVE